MIADDDKRLQLAEKLRGAILEKENKRSQSGVACNDASQATMLGEEEIVKFINEIAFSSRKSNSVDTLPVIKTAEARFNVAQTALQAIQTSVQNNEKLDKTRFIQEFKAVSLPLFQKKTVVATLSRLFAPLTQVDMAQLLMPYTETDNQKNPSDHCIARATQVSRFITLVKTKKMDDLVKEFFVYAEEDLEKSVLELPAIQVFEDIQRIVEQQGMCLEYCYGMADDLPGVLKGLPMTNYGLQDARFNPQTGDDNQTSARKDALAKHDFYATVISLPECDKVSAAAAKQRRKMIDKISATVIAPYVTALGTGIFASFVRAWQFISRKLRGLFSSMRPSLAEVMTEEFSTRLAGHQELSLEGVMEASCPPDLIAPIEDDSQQSLAAYDLNRIKQELESYQRHLDPSNKKKETNRRQSVIAGTAQPDLQNTGAPPDNEYDVLNSDNVSPNEAGAKKAVTLRERKSSYIATLLRLSGDKNNSSEMRLAQFQDALIARPVVNVEEMSLRQRSGAASSQNSLSSASSLSDHSELSSSAEDFVTTPYPSPTNSPDRGSPSRVSSGSTSPVLSQQAAVLAKHRNSWFQGGTGITRGGKTLGNICHLLAEVEPSSAEGMKASR